jgi:outer membrane protein TolC
MATAYVLRISSNSPVRRQQGGLRPTEFNFAGHSVGQLGKAITGKIEFCTSEPYPYCRAAATTLLACFIVLLAGCQQALLTTPNAVDRYCQAAVEDLELSASDAVEAANNESPAAPETVPAGPASLEPLPEATLTLSDVIQSVYESYPLLEVALRERDIAEGKELATWGEFDTGLKAYSLADPMGFYQRYRNVVRLDQPLPGGGDVFAGYKLGRGQFHPYAYEEETNRGGEFSAGIGVPLLKDRLIDKRRSGLSQAALARQAVEPAVQTQLLDFVRDASQAYWYWVATGKALQTHRHLLQLAQDRVEQIEQRVQSGDLERLARIDNQRLIASREAKVIDAQRKLQMASIKLSLFLRTPDGQPLLPDVSLLPGSFPGHTPPDVEQLQQDIQAALATRPELVELDFLTQQMCVELAQAENLLLPKFDAVLEASQDVGSSAFPNRSKSPFTFEAGVYGEVPLQRREARGKIAAARGKLAQLRAKREFVTNKIAAQVQDAVSALEAASGKIERTGKNLDLSRQALALGREAFNAGDIDLIVLNIYEQAVADAQISWLEAQAEFFAAEAEYQAALARDPLVSDAS